MISTVEGVQYGGGYAVWTCHIISMMEGVEYGPVTYQYGRGCAVQEY